MDNKTLQIFLSNILHDRSANSLLDAGVDFKSMAVITDHAIENGWLVIGSTDITLSQLGIEKLSELQKDKRNIPKEQWIIPEERSRIRKITKDFIFLPNKNELP